MEQKQQEHNDKSLSSEEVIQGGENISPGESHDKRTSPLWGDISQKSAWMAGGFFVLFVFVVLLVIDGGASVNRLYSPESPRVSYVEVKKLVPDKISQSASIVVSIPEDLTIDEVKGNVTFSPDIKGVWLEIDSEESIVFEPSEPLEIDRYYSVVIESSNAPRQKDFKVVEDPKIDGVFPKNNSEVDENSSITIMFSRPMVPLSTLGYLESDAAGLPVMVTPATEGRWKWVGTRSLQFIPDDRLIRSSQYRVSISEGFTSMDGLSVAPLKHSFKTRPLRFENITRGQIGYRQPILLRFNQPVDIDHIRTDLQLKNNTTGKYVDATVEYHSYVRYNNEKDYDERVIDRSIINLISAVDSHGRDNIWDFESSYVVVLATAQPLEGDLAYSRNITSLVTVSDSIRSITARSQRSRQVSLELFDPQGTIDVSFYEDIDLKKSSISAKGITSIEYAHKCEEVNVQTLSDECQKVDDKSQIHISFDETQFSKGETFSLDFNEIYTVDGFKLNTKTHKKSVTIFPAFKILKTSPSSGTQNASLTELEICSNVPIVSHNSETYTEGIATEGYMVFSRWGSSYLLRSLRYRDTICSLGEYTTTIRYGLLPETDYSIGLNLSDEFSQTGGQTIAFRTGEADSNTLRFHSMQKRYNMTTPDATKLTYATENFPYVDVHICKVSPERLLEVVTYGPADSPDQEDCIETKTDKINQPQQLWVNHYFQIKLADYFEKPLGSYVVSFSHPSYTRKSGKPTVERKIYEYSYVNVTNLAVVNKEVFVPQSIKTDIIMEAVNPSKGKGNVYWVSRVGSMDPVSNALVRVFTNTEKLVGAGFTTSALTDSNGVARTLAQNGIKGVVVTSGDDAAVVSHQADTIKSVRGARDNLKMYVYTDRPIYRPGHEVKIKGIFRVQYDGIFEVFDARETTVKVLNSKREVILKQKLAVSEYGTFDTAVELPSDAPLGSYLIQVEGVNTSFSVEEYVPAAFKVGVAADKPEYVSGDTVRINFDAEYYFGVPLDGGEVSYQITTQDYHFDRYKDEYFNFGSGWYQCYGCGYGDSYLGRGEVSLDDNGHALLEKQFTFSELFDEDEYGSKIVVVHATVKDGQGKSVSAQKSFIVHAGEYYLGVKTDPGYAPEGSAVEVKVKTVDTEGEPIAVSDIALAVNKVEWNYYKRKEVDGGFYYKWEQEITPLLAKKIKTNRSGNFTENILFAESGRYEITLTGIDDLGNEISVEDSVYIYGGGSVSVRPTNNATLELEVKKQNVEVGDTAQFIIKSPYKKAKALVSIERGRIFEYEVIELDSGLVNYEFAIGEEYVPNVFASVLLLSPDPEVKFGQIEYTVGRETKELVVNVVSDKDFYLPGEQVVLDISTEDFEGTGIPAEVSIAVVDMSVLALKGNPKKDPLVFFYKGFPLTVLTGSNIRNVLHEMEIPTGTKGGGGGDPDDLSKKKRGVFKDTAFWEANVQTDKTGAAQLTFTLPDNLTQWQVESVGVTKDTKLGVNYKEFTAQKNLMAVPLAPRFIIPGDVFDVGVKVFNQTQESQRLDVSIESSTLQSVDGVMSEQVKISAGETKTVYFSMKAPEAFNQGLHTFTLSALNDEYEDVVDKYISVTENNTYESVATANFTADIQAQEYLYLPETIIPDKGGVTIKANATMAVYLSDALNYLIGFPYGCSEQMASKLAALATVKKGLNVENVGDGFELDAIRYQGKEYSVDDAVEIGLKKIYTNQKYSGGFSYYQSLGESYYLSVHILDTLLSIRDAGYQVRGDVIERASKYVEDRTMNQTRYHISDDYVITAAYVLRDVGLTERLKNRVHSITSKSGYLSEKISSNSLAYLAILSHHDLFSSNFSENVYILLENRIDIDSRGAYLKSNQGNISWRYYETPIKNTALLLKALTARGEDHPLQGRIIRWLLASRSKDGAWGSTNNSLAVIDAMTDFLEYSRESESDYALSVTLGDTPVASFDFNKDTVFDLVEEYIPIADIEKGVMQTLTFTKEPRNELKNTLYYDIGMKYYLPVDSIPPRDEGVYITRELYAATDRESTTPIYGAKVGDIIRGEITITTGKPRLLFGVEDFIPAGTELINFELSTEDNSLLNDNGRKGASTNNRLFSKWYSLMANTLGSLNDDLPVVYAEDRRASVYQPLFRPDHKELQDDRLFLFKESLPAGTYTYEYYLRVTTPGDFQHLPAIASELYFPENFGRTAGRRFAVEEVDS